jgi:hypothetical protein
MDELKQLRSALNALSNTGGADVAFDSVEIEARIDKTIVDASPTFSEVRAMIPRDSMNGQGSYIWNVRTSDNGSSKWGYSYSEVPVSGTNTGTPAQGAKVQLSAVAKSFRTDWAVENFMKYASGSYYDAVSDEIMNALKAHINEEEMQIVTGTASSGYGDASGFLGLRQIVNSFVTIGDTTTIYGKTRASTLTYLDAQVVDAAAAAFKISFLDKAITALSKKAGVPGYFLCSYDRADEINSKLQAQQRFTGSMNIAGGFVVSTYQGIPILKSRYMDKAGESNTDTKIFLIGAGNLVMKVLKETGNVPVAQTRYDEVGGFISTYEVLVAKDLTKNVVIDDIAVPAI